MKQVKKIFMPVYNQIDYDGRVQRAAEALGDSFDVLVYSIDSGNKYRNEKFRVRAVKLPRWKKAGNLKMLTDTYFCFRLCLEALWERPAIVFAHDFFMSVPGWIAAKITGAKLVYDAHELIVPEAGCKKRGKELLFYLMEKWTVKRSDLILAASRERAKRMQSYYHLIHTPLVIRNISPNLPEQLGADETRRRYPRLARNRIDLIRLVYQGDMKLDRRIDDFIRAMKFLDSRFELALVGDGPDLDALISLTRKEGLDDKVIFLRKVPRSHLYDILQLCDIGIVTYPREGLNNVYCAPNKVYEYAQAGLPIIARDNPVLAKLFKAARLGVVAYDDITEAVRDLVFHREQYKQSLVVFVRLNTWEAEATSLRARINQLMT